MRQTMMLMITLIKLANLNKLNKNKQRKEIQKYEYCKKLFKRNYPISEKVYEKEHGGIRNRK